MRKISAYPISSPSPRTASCERNTKINLPAAKNSADSSRFCTAMVAKYPETFPQWVARYTPPATITAATHSHLANLRMVWRFKQQPPQICKLNL